MSSTRIIWKSTRTEKIIPLIMKKIADISLQPANIWQVSIQQAQLKTRKIHSYSYLLIKKKQATARVMRFCCQISLIFSSYRNWKYNSHHGGWICRIIGHFDILCTHCIELSASLRKKTKLRQLWKKNSCQRPIWKLAPVAVSPTILRETPTFPRNCT